MGNNSPFLKKLQIKLLYDLAVPLLKNFYLISFYLFVYFVVLSLKPKP
jgi:hypothetical protein